MAFHSGIAFTALTYFMDPPSGFLSYC
jgi:hypothetical protein